VNLPKKIKIGIDFHGVLTENVAIFNGLSALICALGHEVHIMTGSRKETFAKECDKLGVKPLYTHFFSITQYCIDSGAEVDLTDPDNPRVKDEVLWDSAKAKYAAENDISLVIDDSPRYGEYFTTPFVLYKNKHNENLFKHELIKEIVKRSR